MQICQVYRLKEVGYNFIPNLCLYIQVELNFYDTGSSSTASMVACSDPICPSVIQPAASDCTNQNNQCGYSFQYGDGSGTSGYYVSDILYFDMVLGNSLIVNSSAPIIFG